MSDQPSQFGNTNFPWSSEPSSSPDDPLTPIHAATEREREQQTYLSSLPSYDSSSTSVLPTTPAVNQYSSERYGSLAAEAQSQYTYDAGATYGSGPTSSYASGSASPYNSSPPAYESSTPACESSSYASPSYEAPTHDSAGSAGYAPSQAVGYEASASSTYDGGRTYPDDPAPPQYSEAGVLGAAEVGGHNVYSQTAGEVGYAAQPQGEFMQHEYTDQQGAPDYPHDDGLLGHHEGPDAGSARRLPEAEVGGAPSGGSGMVAGAREAAGDGKGVVSALFDFTFTNLVTPKLVRFVYLLATIGLGLGWVFFLFSAFATSATFGLVVLVFGPLLLLVYLALIRMTLEFYLSITRMAEDINRRLPQA